MDSSSTQGTRIDNRVCPIVPGRCRRQGAAFCFIQLDRFFDDLAEFSKDLFFIVPVASTVKKARATSDEALIFLGPFNDLYVSSSDIHDLDSSIARLTARS